MLPRHAGQQFEPSQWWKSLLATAYLTGWRIRELLALRWEDVDLERGVIITRHQDNKGKRDERVPVHPVVMEHFRQIAGNDRRVFTWRYDQRRLWTEFGRIQLAAGINLVCRENHKHTNACHVYGFHDLRRAFATVNAKRLKPEVLQKMMRHKSFSTTLGYTNLAEQVEEAVTELRIPEVLKQSGPGAAEKDANKQAEVQGGSSESNQ